MVTRFGQYLGSIKILRPKRAGPPQTKTVLQKGGNQITDVWRNVSAIPYKPFRQPNRSTNPRPIQNAVAKPDRRLTPYRPQNTPPQKYSQKRQNSYGRGNAGNPYPSTINKIDRLQALKAKFTADQVKSHSGEIAQQIAQKSEENPFEAIVVSNTGFNTKQAQTLREVKNEVLRIKAVWPFDFFPDELIIEEKRIVVNRRHFFLFNTIDTIPISNIFVFEVTHALFFSSIYIKGGEFGGIEVEIKWLKLKDAKRAKQIIDGLYMREKGLIEVTEEDPKRRMEIIKKIGEAYTTS